MSKVYYSPIEKLALRLVRAHVEEVPMDREITVTDRRQNEFRHWIARRFNLEIQLLTFPSFMKMVV